ncbi:response regulator transcription factor [Agreia sp. COWG]|uniref:response regulator n=1 Tax=Agreia sp. COWG TaxID=2773266 RepID=UPI001926F292|nr:response regulator transcription factor [Agreia sp. COWG]CAD5990223.1 Two component transcriptional regulator, LuxR family [Agreia sp. COWG]
MIRVVVIDDEALVRSGFRFILEAVDDIRVVGATDGLGAVELIAATRPDVVLLDIRMPGRNGLDILAELNPRGGGPVVAMLTTFDTDSYIADALRKGASGYLVKDTDPEQLPHLVRSLASGGVVLSAEASRAVLHSGLGTVGDDRAKLQVSRLTARERDVLLLLAQGSSNTEIGAQLHLSGGTIKDHVSSILAKFEVATRVQAALVADRAGLLAHGRSER